MNVLTLLHAVRFENKVLAFMIYSCPPPNKELALLSWFLIFLIETRDSKPSVKKMLQWSIFNEERL